MASRNRNKKQTLGTPVRPFVPTVRRTYRPPAAKPVVKTAAPVQLSKLFTDVPKPPSFVERFEAQSSEINGLRKENETLRSQLTLTGVRITLLTQLLEVRLAEVLGVEINLKEQE